LARRSTSRERAGPAPTAGGDDAGAHSVLVAIPLRHRLSTKLLGATAALALAALGGLVFAERRMQADMLGQLERSTALLADAVQTSAEDAMHDARPFDRLRASGAHSYAMLSRVADLDGVQRVRVFDKAGRIRFSTEPGDGGILVKSEGACLACHAAAQPRSFAPTRERARILDGRQGRTLALTAPIRNGARCATAECHVHPPGRQVLGLLEIGVSLAPLDATVLAFRRGFVGLLAGAAVLVATLLYLFGRGEVVEPVAALVEGTRRVARDDLDVEVRVHARGEMGVLAASFNEMTRALRQLEGELWSLNAGLEEEVRARTAALEAAQEQLVRTEKLSSLGKLSASIAHEINNPLAGILTFAKLVSRTLEEGAPDDAKRAGLRRHLALVEREAQRCSAIVRNLLDFARERPIAPKPMDVNAAVDEALSLVANQIAMQGVALHRTHAELPPVLADFGQLRQAFVNVVMNACEAMGKGGRLEVATRASAGVIQVVIADDGPGIPPERLRKIFDPFFTTKEKGTGLGLSVVYGIVERHGGSIDVDSRVGEGTTFTFRLPAVAEEQGVCAPSATSSGPMNCATDA
jgi:two-component system, NtrC family, sensor kinase